MLATNIAIKEVQQIFDCKNIHQSTNFSMTQTQFRPIVLAQLLVLFIGFYWIPYDGSQHASKMHKCINRKFCVKCEIKDPIKNHFESPALLLPLFSPFYILKKKKTFVICTHILKLLNIAYVPVCVFELCCVC